VAIREHHLFMATSISTLPVFSKKLENFKAAIGLNFAYYNFVKTHSALRVRDLVEMAQ
jgi:hypothetical protein